MQMLATDIKFVGAGAGHGCLVAKVRASILVHVGQMRQVLYDALTVECCSANTWDHLHEDRLLACIGEVSCSVTATCNPSITPCLTSGRNEGLCGDCIAGCTCEQGSHCLGPCLHVMRTNNNMSHMTCRHARQGALQLGSKIN